MRILHLVLECALMSHMPVTILIVDDEKNTREGLSIALEEEYEVYMASGADEAFNLMEAETFDIVLTDLRMAGKSGLKVIDRAITQAKTRSERPLTVCPRPHQI